VNKEFMQSVLRNAAGMLYIIPLDELEAYVKEVRDNNNRWNSVGAILDPTAFRDAMHNGKLEQAKAELEMAEHLLEVRRLVEALNLS
jgi:hypothetical protein